VSRNHSRSKIENMNRTSSFLDMKKNNEKRSSKLGQYDKKGGASVKIKRGETHTS